MNKKTVKDIDVKGQRVLVRVDFNVPLDDNGNITDDTRIVAALPTIEYLLDNDAKVILVSHLGRPKGEVNPKYSLKPVAAYLQKLLPGRKIVLADDVVGASAQAAVANIQDGEIVLLENVRYEPGETKNDKALAEKLASFADVYVNDAFGTAHRAHASTEGVAQIIPGVAGFLMEKELDIMGGALENPARPFVAVLGGAKISDKIGVIKNLLTLVDTLLIGGGMANTFIKAKGLNVGSSLVDEESLDLAKELMAEADAKKVEMLLPTDFVVADKFSNDAESMVVAADAIPDGWMALDIGPDTQKRYAEVVKKAQTVIWNGPMGVFEMPKFAEGTRSLAAACADCSGTTIIGGGDSAAAVKTLGYGDKVTHISTGGGASLEFLEGIELPGVAALQDK